MTSASVTFPPFISIDRYTDIAPQVPECNPRCPRQAQVIVGFLLSLSILIRFCIRFDSDSGILAESEALLLLEAAATYIKG
jgi:hypothetical protein